MAAAEFAAQLGKIIIIDAAPAEQDALLHQHLDILVVLCHGIGKIFFAADRFAQKRQRVRFKIIKDGLRLVQNRQIPVDAHRIQPAFQPLDVPLQMFLDLHTRLTLLGCHLLTQQIGKLLRTLVKHLPCRRDGDLLDAVLTTLGIHLEGGHGVNLIVPKLDSHRLAAVRRKDVQNAATACKLADALHLVPALVTHCHQLFDHLLLVVAAVHVDGQDRIFERFLRDGAFTGRFCRSDHHPGSSLQQFAEHP